MNLSIEKGIVFEQLVVKFLYKTNPLKINYMEGGRDRGRDIELEYIINGEIYNVIVQCKCYTRSINKEIIMSSLNWAKVHKPDLLYLWIYPYLTTDTKDYIAMFEKEYNICVLYEERINIDEYERCLEQNELTIFEQLREKINISLTKHNYSCNSHFYNYINQILNEDYYLEDRSEERQKLISDNKIAFYIQGVSFSGKTILVKYIIKNSYSKYKIFWYEMGILGDDQLNIDFIEKLTRFLAEQCNDDSLSIYFTEYGNVLTIDLILLICMILSRYNNIIIVVDDIHTCGNTNIQLKKLFMKIISKKICRIYLIGWFYIFDSNPIIDNYIENIYLEGLSIDELNNIIKHYTGQSMHESAKIIKQSYDGLPGFATLLNNNIQIEQIGSEEEFFSELYNLLNENQLIIVQSLSITDTSIPKLVFNKKNLLKDLYDLKNKKIIYEVGENFKLHDRYKKIFNKYANEKMYIQILDILRLAMEINIVFLKDLICLEAKFKNYKSVYQLINEHFYYLINRGYTNFLLSTINELLKNNQCNKMDLFIKKIILFEISTQYQLCLDHIEMVKDEVEYHSKFYEIILYNRLRCLYFTNQYELLLNDFSNEYYKIIKFTNINKLKIFQIVARVFYVKGDISFALKIYLIVFRKAYISSLTKLCIKTLYKIVQIEIYLGFYKEALSTLEGMLIYQDLISLKRKSYIYHRMALCEYHINNLDNAEKFSEKSLKIKESINLQRGLIFSYRLMAQIYCSRNNFNQAMDFINRSIDISIKEKLYKESLNSGIIETKILYQNDKQKIAQEKINQLFIYARKNNFLKSIYKIRNLLYKFDCKNELLREIDVYIDSNPTICKEDVYQNIINYINDCLTESDYIKLNSLMEDKQTISAELLDQLNL